MNKLAVLILSALVSWGGEAYGQSEFDVIDTAKEKEAICQFVQSFCKSSDSTEIQQFIDFGSFQARHTCSGTQGNGGASVYELTDSAIIATGDCECKNPIYFTGQKQLYNKRFRDSLTNANLTLFQHYFSNRENISAYCSWLIKAYKLPKKKESLRPDQCGCLPLDFKNFQGRSVRVGGCGGSIIDVVKKADRYYVVYVGYIWD
ncbi:MAG: hypothetical protein JKX73_08155 [Flavobacteriales bacterium]|nr:hypothetical protein [Flavobacteriales bacterium]